MNKKLFILIASTLILFSCTSKEDFSSQFEGTVWKAPVPENYVFKPEGENYYRLSFYTDNKYRIGIEDKNGVIIRHIWDGKYEFIKTEHSGSKFRLQSREGERTFNYYPKELKIYAEYFGVGLIKQ